MCVKFLVSVFAFAAFVAAAFANDENPMVGFMRDCCESSGITMEKIGGLMGSEEDVDFCNEPETNSWSHCFFQRIGLIDEDHNILSFDSAGPKKCDEPETEESKAGEVCAIAAINLHDHSLRSCTLMGCMKRSGLFGH